MSVIYKGLYKSFCLDDLSLEHKNVWNNLFPNIEFKLNRFKIEHQKLGIRLPLTMVFSNNYYEPPKGRDSIGVNSNGFFIVFYLDDKQLEVWKNLHLAICLINNFVNNNTRKQLEKEIIYTYPVINHLLPVYMVHNIPFPKHHMIYVAFANYIPEEIFDKIECKFLSKCKYLSKTPNTEHAILLENKNDILMFKMMMDEPYKFYTNIKG